MLTGDERISEFMELRKILGLSAVAGLLCLAQIAYPGYGFQYMCNIADTGFLGTFQGKQWQKDYLVGKANVSDTPGMRDCMEYIEKWKDLGMFPTNKRNPQSVYILNVIRYHGLSKKLEENPQKLEDALKVMEILSSVEGTTGKDDKKHKIPWGGYRNAGH